MNSQQRQRDTLIDVRRWDVWRILDMPGLSRIDLLPDEVARLRFTTADGCQPVGSEFIAQEVGRMGVRWLSVAEAHDG